MLFRTHPTTQGALMADDVADDPPKPAQRRSSNITGFSNWVEFLKATIALGVTIGGILYTGILWGLDQRYAPVTISNQIEDARAQVLTTNAKLQRIERALLESQLFETKVRTCTAESGALRQEYESRLSTLQGQFYDLTQRYAQLPDCTGLST